MTNKEKYSVFCETNYVPIYSKPWWMDAVCGPENWDVWLYGGENGRTHEIEAAMPYYMERRGPYRYITKAPLTQNNGIVFKEVEGRGMVTQAKMEEKIINAACAFIKSLDLDVYEQQYHYSFQNWQPFFWNNYTNVLRYTYVIRDTSDLDRINRGITAKYRKKIQKARRFIRVCTDITAEEFYTEHEKVFSRHGLPCPFSRELWNRLYNTCAVHEAGQAFCARDEAGNIHALLYMVWDEKSAYELLGGYIPEFAASQAHPALIYHAITVAHEKGLAYDFEGSMIRRIARARRQFGGTPMPYYRIRKVFNPEIVRKEAEDYIRRVEEEDAPPVGNTIS